LKPRKLSGIGKLRKIRHRAYSREDPAIDQFTLKIAEAPESLTFAKAPESLTIAAAPAPRSQSAELARVGMLVLVLSISAWVLLISVLLMMALTQRLSVWH